MQFWYVVTEASSGYREKRPITDDQTVPRFGIPAELLSREQALQLVNMWNETSLWMGTRNWKYVLQ